MSDFSWYILCENMLNKLLNSITCPMASKDGSELRGCYQVTCSIHNFIFKVPNSMFLPESNRLHITPKKESKCYLRMKILFRLPVDVKKWGSDFCWPISASVYLKTIPICNPNMYIFNTLGNLSLCILSTCWIHWFYISKCQIYVILIQLFVSL